LSEQLKLQQGVTESSNKALTAQRDKLEEYRKKLEDTKKALADAQAAGTANEEELKKLERAVSNANAQFELSQRRVDEWARNVRNSESAQRTMEASMRDAVNEINNFGGAIEEAGNKTGGFFSALSANVVGDAITGVFKSLANNAKQYMEQGAELARQWQEAQGKLVQVMGNTMGATREQVEAINELTLAQQLGINASSEGAANIATMLGKVMDGQTGALKRYG
jgi:predicted RNase H-like nuclease (RuvC/YqgF family)